MEEEKKESKKKKERKVVAGDKVRNRREPRERGSGPHGNEGKQ